MVTKSIRDIRAQAHPAHVSAPMHGERRKYAGRYHVGKENTLRRGSYREAMLRCAQKHNTVEAAEKAWAKTEFGEAGHKIAWLFLEREGYVVFAAAH